MIINRAPVLTLWAMIVAQRMGYSEAQALTLGKAVAGYTAQFKGRTLGIYTAKEKEEGSEEKAERLEAQWIEFMGRRIPLTKVDDQVFAAEKDKAIDPDAVRRYLQGKYGESLDEIAAAMEDLAGAYEPEELNKIAFRLYEKFRPEIPKGKKGWGAKGELNPQKNPPTQASIAGILTAEAIPEVFIFSWNRWVLIIAKSSLPTLPRQEPPPTLNARSATACCCKAPKKTHGTSLQWHQKQASGLPIKRSPAFPEGGPKSL